MTNQEIYDAALRFASEVPDTNANEDYKERAPYLISAICYKYATLDATYRQTHGMEKQKLLAINCFPLPTTFPLSDIFAPPVSMAVAGMLVLEENPKMSEELTRMADKLISEIQDSIPFQKEKIQSHYVF